MASLAGHAGPVPGRVRPPFHRLREGIPIAFLIGQRLALAADLLRNADATVEAVAGRVGYGSLFALGTAFKRAHGLSPRDYRAQLDDHALLVTPCPNRLPKRRDPACGDPIMRP